MTLTVRYRPTGWVPGAIPASLAGVAPGASLDTAAPRRRVRLVGEAGGASTDTGAVSATPVADGLDLSGVIYSDDFQNDSLGDYTEGGHGPPRGVREFVNDPTGEVGGRVLHLIYTDDEGAGSDAEIYIQRTNFGGFPSGEIGAGDGIYTYGKFFIVPNGFTGNRKLWRYYVGSQGGTGSDITLWFAGTMRAEGPDGARDLYFVNTGATTTIEDWHEIETYMQMDSSAGAGDGILRIWLDRTLIHENTSFQFTNVSNPRLSLVRWGYQTHSTRTENGQVRDDRYWSRMLISTSRIAA